MATVTAKARKTKVTAPPAKPAESSAPRILVSAIHPHPDNPRKTFDKEQLAKLADSIRRNDVLQPVLVRPAWRDMLQPESSSQQYQIICGERRWRAAKLAGLESIPAVVRAMSDAEALELMIVENEEREDLNPIELALGLTALTKPVTAGGVGLTHQEAARRFGHEEAWATNLMRILALPPIWRERVASGELPQTFARAMLPYAKCMGVLTWIEKQIAQDGLDHVRRDDFERWLRNAVRDVTRPIDERDKPFNDYRLSNAPFGRLFKLTPEHEAQLNITELPVDIGGWNKRNIQLVRRATNIELWEKLQNDAKVEKIRRKAEKQKGKGTASANGKAPTAADLKRKREEQDASLARRAEDWAEDLVRLGLCREIKSGEWDWLARWFCRWFARSLEGSSWNATGSQADAFEQLGARDTCEDESWSGGLAWINPQDDPIGRLDELDRKEAQVILNPEAEDRLRVDRDVIYSLASIVGVKLADEWKACGGDRLKAFFAMPTLEQLLDLAKELGDHLAPNVKKGVAVELLCDAHARKPYPLPAVLKACGPAKRGRKPR